MEPLTTVTATWILAMVMLTGQPVGDFPNLTGTDGCFAAYEHIITRQDRPAQVVCVPAGNDTYDMIAIMVEGDKLYGVHNGNYEVVSGGEYTKLSESSESTDGCFDVRNHVMNSKASPLQAVCVHTDDGQEHHLPR